MQSSASQPFHEIEFDFFPARRAGEQSLNSVRGIWMMEHHWTKHVFVQRRMWAGTVRIIGQVSSKNKTSRLRQNRMAEGFARLFDYCMV